MTIVKCRAARKIAAMITNAQQGQAGKATQLIAANLKQACGWFSDPIAALAAPG